jgi:hypothetical protein
MDGVPFEAFGGVDGAEGEVVVVEVGGVRVVGARAGRVEDKLREEPAQVRRLGCGGDEPVEVLQPHRPVGVVRQHEGLDYRVEPRCDRADAVVA